MNPHELLTKADLAEFEKRFIDRISDFLLKVNTIPPAPEDDGLLSRKKLLKYLDISENQFKEYLEAGLPSIPIGKRAKYNKRAVLKYLENQKHFGL